MLLRDTKHIAGNLSVSVVKIGDTVSPWAQGAWADDDSEVRLSLALKGE